VVVCSLVALARDCVHAGMAIRPLAESEWASFRDLRLRALTTAPGVFAESYEHALGHDETYWRETVAGDDEHQVFGLFDGLKLVGITAVFTYREDPTGETALFAMSYIVPEYRGQGLAGLLYHARLDWVRAHAQFNRVIVSHRESNEASRRANQAFGFRFVRRERRTWPDRVDEDELHYELEVRG
jgi:RimJ/RimL family protein N-acetyltransferase